MNEILKSFGGALHRYYNAVLQRPMPWRMIDALVSLEETCERDATSDPSKAGQAKAGQAASGGERRVGPPSSPDGGTAGGASPRREDPA